jgi:hypothetical protein
LATRRSSGGASVTGSHAKEEERRHLVIASRVCGDSKNETAKRPPDI